MKPKLLIIIILSVVLLGGGGYFAYIYFFQQEESQPIVEEAPDTTAFVVDTNFVDSTKKQVNPKLKSALPQKIDVSGEQVTDASTTPSQEVVDTLSAEEIQKRVAIYEKLKPETIAKILAQEEDDKRVIDVVFALKKRIAVKVIEKLPPERAKKILSLYPIE